MPVISPDRLGRRGRSQPAGSDLLRAQDAFYVHDVSPAIARQLGVVLRLEDAAAAMPLRVLTEHISALIAERAGALPMLGRRLLTVPGRWPRWLAVADVDADEHLTVREVADGQASWRSAVHDFFSSPLPTDRPPWQLQLLRDTSSGATAIVVKMHHALGDGIAMTDALVLLLSDGQQAVRARARPAGARNGRRRAVRALTVLRGLAGLVRPATAASLGLDPASTGVRRFATLELPGPQLRASARAYRSSSSAVLLTVLAGALSRLVESRRAGDGGARAMVSRTTRPTRTGAEGGNWTVAVAVELPSGSMPPADRLRTVEARLAAAEAGGQSVATAAVLAGLGMLPAPLYLRFIRRISGRRFFDLLVGVMPGSRRMHRIAGLRVAAALPILPIGSAGLAVGFLNWADTVGVGVTADEGLLENPDVFAGWIREAFDELRAAEPVS